MRHATSSYDPHGDRVGQGLADRTPANGDKGRAHALLTISLSRWLSLIGQIVSVTVALLFSLSFAPPDDMFWGSGRGFEAHHSTVSWGWVSWFLCFGHVSLDVP